MDGARGWPLAANMLSKKLGLRLTILTSMQRPFGLRLPRGSESRVAVRELELGGAQVWPAFHPHGSGSVRSEAGAGSLKAHGRNKAASIQSWFRRTALWGFWFLDRRPREETCYLPRMGAARFVFVWFRPQESSRTICSTSTRAGVAGDAQLARRTTRMALRGISAAQCRRIFRRAGDCLFVWSVRRAPGGGFYGCSHTFDSNYTLGGRRP